jgi:hypothetical protein
MLEIERLAHRMSGHKPAAKITGMAPACSRVPRDENDPFPAATTVQHLGRGIISL